MKDSIQFETPENVQVTYEIAGLGSRFVAWFEDQLILLVLLFIVFLCLLFLGMGNAWVVANYFPSGVDEKDSAFYFIGLATLIMGFANFIYFGLSELLMRGQTIGKRHAHIRVVKLNGYALDAGSILMRNAFRVLDHIPLLWIVPAFAPRSQRLGDMLAGTLCISDEQKTLGSLREVLLARPATEREFRFDIGALNRARQTDIEAVERILENIPTMTEERQAYLLEIICNPLAERLQVPEPDPGSRRQFLEDFLAADYRRRQRQLG